MGSLVDERGYCLPAQTLWVSFLHLLCLVNHMYVENKYENYHMWRNSENVFHKSVLGSFYKHNFRFNRGYVFHEWIKTLNLPAVVVLPSTSFKCNVMFGTNVLRRQCYQNWKQPCLGISWKNVCLIVMGSLKIKAPPFPATRLCWCLCLLSWTLSPDRVPVIE